MYVVLLGTRVQVRYSTVQYVYDTPHKIMHIRTDDHLSLPTEQPAAQNNNARRTKNSMQF